MERSYLIVIMLLFSLMFGYLAGTIIRLQPIPVSLWISSVSTETASTHNNDTIFRFNVTLEAWNGRYRNVGIRHGENCGILPGIRSTIDDLVWLSPPYCDPSLNDQITVIAPGLTTYNRTLHILLPGNYSELPPGQYNIYPLPTSIEYRESLQLTVIGDGTRDIQTSKPDNWGKTLVFQTPLTWYFPTFVLLVLSVTNIINRVFSNQVRVVMDK